VNSLIIQCGRATVDAGIRNDTQEGVAMIIRTATLADAEATAAVQVESWLHTYPGMVPESYLQAMTQDRDQRVQRHRERTATDAIRLVACDDTGRVVGWLSGGAGRDQRWVQCGYSGEIYAIYLLPGWLRQGIGSALFTEAFGHLHSLGHHQAYVCVLRENAPAIAFYQRWGGSPVGEGEVDIGGRACPELIMGFERLDAPPKTRR
jgi:ribosomal protein S18 acetylase RimI-like enzyme